MSYDHWKSTEPESGYDPPEETADEAYDRAFAKLSATCLDLKAERDKFQAALRKIAAWKGYMPHNTAGRSNALNPYEVGANDMLATLKQMAEEALA